MDSEQEDLDALVTSGGWVLFCQHVQQEWGTTEGGGAVFLAAVKAAASVTSDAEATAKLRQIVVAQREIHKLLAWSAERLAYLKQTALSAESDGVPLSRRGIL